jgi:hypothetical protein
MRDFKDAVSVRMRLGRVAASLRCRRRGKPRLYKSFSDVRDELRPLR